MCGEALKRLEKQIWVINEKSSIFKVCAFVHFLLLKPTGLFSWHFLNRQQKQATESLGFSKKLLANIGYHGGLKALALLPVCLLLCPYFPPHRRERVVILFMGKVI